MTGGVRELVIAPLMRDEGFRSQPYRDAAGVMTIGYGTNLDEGLTKDEAMFLLESRVDASILDCQRAFTWFAELDKARQGVLVQMRYQLGLGGLLGFRQMLAALEAGDAHAAADAMLDSKWARDDTPERALRLSRAMRTGRDL
jgi:lysozyme